MNGSNGSSEDHLRISASVGDVERAVDAIPPVDSNQETLQWWPADF